MGYLNTAGKFPGNILTARNSARPLGGGESEERARGGKQDAAPVLECSESKRENNQSV